MRTPNSLASALAAAPRMSPVDGPPTTWQLPAILTEFELAAWLGISFGELQWFADCQARERRVAREPLRHYRYRWIRKRHKTARLIESPKPRLKALQRRVLHELLDRIPPHEAAHGFRAGRSVASFAAPHAGQRVVLKMDLQDFFTSVSSARVTAIFATAGFPDRVARLLAGLCTNSVPPEVLDDYPFPECAIPRWRMERPYRAPHLPQGAPTSPALANLIAYRLDCRLTALARAAGASYTRYADDLVFSGGHDFERSARRFHIHAGAIALEEGFQVNTRKTRIMRQSVRQRIAGLVVNQHLNVARDEFDHLKATLHNCVRHGPESQNRQSHADFRAHLTGRVAYAEMVHGERGKKLRELLARIEWQRSRSDG